MQLPTTAIATKVGGWSVNFDGDGVPDSCQIVAQQRASGVSCTLSSSKSAVQTGVIDLGYPEGRAWVDFDGDRRDDFCRVIGNGYPSSFVTCTVSNGTAFGPTFTSTAIDWGYPETRHWRDANGDKKADFCRVIGNRRELLSCTFSMGRAQQPFGKTVNSPR
jgi:hypothetical protein